MTSNDSSLKVFSEYVLYTGYRTHVLCATVANLGGLMCVMMGYLALFYFVYIAGLLISLHRAGLGCHIVHMFVGVLAYEADLVLLAPLPCHVLCYSVVNSMPRNMMCYSMLISLNA